MYLLINSLLVLLNGGLQFIVLSFLLTPKTKQIKNISLYFLLLYASVFFKCAATTTLISAIFGLCTTVTLFSYTIYAFTNPFWEKIGKCVLMLGFVTITTEAVFSVFSNYVLHTSLSMDYYSETMVLPLFLLDLFTLAFCILFLFLVKLVERIKRIRRFFLVSLLIFLLFLHPTILLFIYTSDISENNLTFSLIAPIILSITNLFLFLSVMNQEEKAATNAAYRELQTLYKMEEEHYRQLEQHSEALAKIRHDFHNQLATIHLLLQNENYADAKDMAHHMKELLNSMTSASDCS